MKIFKLTLFLNICSLFFISCSSELNDNTNDTTISNTNSELISKKSVLNTPQVYAAGSVYDVNGMIFEKSWLNGLVNNSSTVASDGKSIFIDGTDIYIAGVIYTSSQRLGTIWKNGNVYAQFGSITYANSVYVKDSKVYVGGIVWTDPAIWVDGVLSYLPKLTPNSGGNVNSIVVSTDNQIHTVGNLLGKAILWKNGTIISLSNNASDATSIKISGTNLYVSGYEINPSNSIKIAKYWIINSSGTVTSVNLTSGTNLSAVANSIYINNGDVFVCGYENKDATGTNTDAKLWKNGALVSLSSPTNTFSSKGTSVFVKDNIAYVGGNYFINNNNIKACLWTDGVFNDYNSSSPGSYINSIFVN